MKKFQCGANSLLNWMRFMYVYNIVGAGAVGLTVLLTPNFATQYMFSGAICPDAAMSILGSIWLGVGVLSILGLFYPLPFSSILLLQLLYKLVWLLFIAIPAFLTGDNASMPLVMTILFIFWVIGLAFAIPLRYLFAIEPKQ